MQPSVPAVAGGGSSGSSGSSGSRVVRRVLAEPAPSPLGRGGVAVKAEAAPASSAHACPQGRLVGAPCWMMFDDRRFYEGRVLSQQLDVLRIDFDDEPHPVQVRVAWSGKRSGTHSGLCKQRLPLQLDRPLNCTAVPYTGTRAH